MIRKIGRFQLIGIAVILAVFFAAELAMHAFDESPQEQEQAQARLR